MTRSELFYLVAGNVMGMASVLLSVLAFMASQNWRERRRIRKHPMRWMRKGGTT